jgi:hypothetical protein
MSSVPIFHCDACNEPREGVICPKCGADTRLAVPPLPLADASEQPPPAAPEIAQPQEASLEQLATRVSQEAALPPPPPPPPPAATWRAEIPPPPPAENAFARAEETEPPQEDIGGLDEFHALLDRGVKAIVVCGGPKAGKSEIAAGFIRANNVFRGKAQNLTLRASLRTDYALGATNPGEVWYQVIDDKRTFLDPSGEFFRRLSPDERQRFGLPDVTEGDFRFVQRAVRALAGVVLVVDLTHAVDPRAAAAWRRQEEDLKFVLSALRWLRWDREARPPALGVSANIAQRASALPQLDKPVLVLFSKADQLTKLTNQSPLLFAKRRLPILHGALMTHARRYRYDFCNTMIQTDKGDEAVDPCGVLLPMEWLLDDRFRWLPWQLPTRLIGGGK